MEDVGRAVQEIPPVRGDEAEAHDVEKIEMLEYADKDCVWQTTFAEAGRDSSKTLPSRERGGERDWC